MTQRTVVVLCGPPGAGKTTAARESGLTVFDRDDPAWVSDRHFADALTKLRTQWNAQAVVIRAAPTSKARRDVAEQVGATHTYLITADREHLARRIQRRDRADVQNTLAALDAWHRRHDRDDNVLPFPGWAAITGDEPDLGITS